MWIELGSLKNIYLNDTFFQTCLLDNFEKHTKKLGKGFYETPRNTVVRKLFEVNDFGKSSVKGEWIIENLNLVKIPSYFDFTATYDKGRDGCSEKLELSNKKNESDEIPSESEMSATILLSSQNHLPKDNLLASNKLVNEIDDIIRKNFKLDSTTNLNNGGLDKTKGWDSLSHIGLVLALETHFKITLEVSEMENMKNYDGLVKTIISVIENNDR